MDKLRWDRTFALEQAADDKELLRELIEIFKDSCVADFNTITQGITNKDAEAVCAAAHSIKGAAASLGIESIRDVSSAIEIDSRDNSLEVAESRVGELDELLQLVQKL